MMKVNLPPEALAALNKTSDEPVIKAAPVMVLPERAQRVAHAQVMHSLFGPSMKPTFRQQLLHYSSFAAIKASWESDEFSRKMKERRK